MHTRVSSLVLALGTLALLFPIRLPAGEGDRLVVYLSATGPASSDFRARALAPVDSLCAATGVTLDIRDVPDGAPPEITTAPALVFQNARGRSVYAGRYLDISKLAHFIRVSRVVPQEPVPYPLENVPLYRSGRGAVAAVIKITPLEGNIPDQLDAHAFAGEIRRAVDSAFNTFKLESRVDLSRTDARMYFDFYPYLSDRDGLMVSLALFAAHDCVEPVFVTTEPVTGSVASPSDVFMRATRLIEAAALAHLRHATNGDALDFIDASTPTITWDAMGLALPPAARDSGHVSFSGALPTRWISRVSQTDDAPTLQYRFMPPLDTYTGTASTVAAELMLDQDGSLRDATGLVSVETASVTTGQAKLDHTIHDQVIKVSRFPRAQFRLDRCEGELQPLRVGEIRHIDAVGEFEMLGRRIPMRARATLEPTVDATGQPLLIITAIGRFNVTRDFGLEGPLGPSPAAETIELRVHLTMVPAGP